MEDASRDDLHGF